MESFSILLVDHNSDYFEACKNILKVHNDKFNVDHATSIEETIQKLVQKYYDVLLLNYNVNSEDGLSVLNRIKAIHASLPVIMLVEEHQEDIAAKAMEQGADDYIMKVSGDQTALPFTIRKVVERNRVYRKTVAQKTNSVTATAADTPEVPQEKISPQPNPKSPTFIINRKGRFLSANEQILDLTGYTIEELLELNISDLLPSETLSQFHRWFTHLGLNGNKSQFDTELVTKFGEHLHISVLIRGLKNRVDEITAYQGIVQPITDEKVLFKPNTPNPQLTHTRIIEEIVSVLNSSLNEPVNYLLERISEIGSQLFKFKRVTLSLLDRKKRVFIKQAIVGQKLRNNGDSTILEVPTEVIQKIFTDPFKLKVVYYNREGLVDFENERMKKMLYSTANHSLTPPQVEWQDEDMLLLNLVDQHKHTFGYISFEKPLERTSVSLDLAPLLENFGKLVSLAIENHYHYAMLERRNRRLKQLLVTSNIFKLHLNLNDLLKEVVWSIKFSIEFNLVGLALVTTRSGMLELKAVACDDKIKLLQLEELKFNVSSIATVLKGNYKQSKSYLIDQVEPVFKLLKEIYFGSRSQPDQSQEWQREHLILVPIESLEQKISGFLIFDDPGDGRIPGKEVIRTLEILANQVGIAIDNRMMYYQMKKRLAALERKNELEELAVENSNEKLGLQRLMNKYFV